jgi:hypothetical protein
MEALNLLMVAVTNKSPGSGAPMEIPVSRSTITSFFTEVAPIYLNQVTTIYEFKLHELRHSTLYIKHPYING